MVRLIAIASLAALFTSCATTTAQSAPAAAAPALSAGPAACTGPATLSQCPYKVDGPTAKMLVASGARLIDVRGPAFYEGGHIAGAVNIPWAQMEQRAAEVGGKETKVVVYCRTGEGSGKAAAALAKLGYQYVYDLGSYLNWGEGAPPATPLPPPAPPPAAH